MFKALPLAKGCHSRRSLGEYGQNTLESLRRYEVQSSPWSRIDFHPLAISQTVRKFIFLRAVEFRACHILVIFELLAMR
jgi:hypothetical protein